jgi:hypothetical protein
VRYPIACEVKEQPERQRSEPRTEERARGRSRRDVEGDDQAATLPRGTRDGPPRADGLSWSKISCPVVAQEPKGDISEASTARRPHALKPSGLRQDRQRQGRGAAAPQQVAGLTEVCGGGGKVACLSQTTYVKTMIANTTLCALWTAIPIQALRYRFVG